jgi:hypothetical protein
MYHVVQLQQVFLCCCHSARMVINLTYLWDFYELGQTVQLNLFFLHVTA